jgi:hypothetical protein
MKIDGRTYLEPNQTEEILMITFKVGGSKMKAPSNLRGQSGLYFKIKLNCAHI